MATKKTETAVEGPIDLSGFDDMVQRQEDGILVPIKGPDGRSSLGFSIKVAGPDSEKAQEALDAIHVVAAPVPARTLRCSFCGRVLPEFAVRPGLAPPVQRRGARPRRSWRRPGGR